MRVAVDPLLGRRNADLGQKLNRPLAGTARIEIGMRLDRLDQLLADR